MIDFIFRLLLMLFIVSTTLHSKITLSEDKFYPAEKLKFGDTLMAKTRIDNNVMHSFPLQVMSVNRNGIANYKSILATTKDPYINEVGLAKGMSGSPVYYEGKLVGAIAFGYSFVRKPIIGITPIREMLGIITNQDKEPNNDYYDKFNQSSKVDTQNSLNALPSFNQPTTSNPYKPNLDHSENLKKWWEQKVISTLRKEASPALHEFLQYSAKTIADPRGKSTILDLIDQLKKTHAPYTHPYHDQQTSPTSKIPSKQQQPHGLFPTFITVKKEFNDPSGIRYLGNDNNGYPPYFTDPNNPRESLLFSFIKEKFPQLYFNPFPTSSLDLNSSLLPTEPLLNNSVTKKKQSTKSSFSSLANHTDNTNGKSIEPGDYIGVNLVRGDIEISAFGTVTYVDKNILLAFGHQMNNNGAINLPLYRARTEMIVPSQLISFKVGSLLEEIGAVKQDRYTGIMGVLGAKADYLNITAQVNSPVQSRKFNFEVVNNKVYGPLLATFILNRMFFLYEGVGQEGTIDYNIRIEYQQTKEEENSSSSIVLSNQVSVKENYFGMFLLMNDIHLVYDIIQRNNRDRGIISNIAININSQPKFDYLNIASIASDKTIYRPGEKIRILVGFDAYQKSREYKEFAYRIPRTTKNGHYQLAIGPSSIRWLIEAVLKKYNYTYDSLEDLLKFVAKRPLKNELSLWQIDTKPSVLIKKQIYQQLPANQQKLLLSSIHNEKEIVTSDINHQDYQLKNNIKGFANFSFTVRKH